MSTVPSLQRPLPKAREGRGGARVRGLNLTQCGAGGILRKRMQKCERRLLGFGGRGRMKISKGNRHIGQIKKKPGASFQLSSPSGEFNGAQTGERPVLNSPSNNLGQHLKYCQAGSSPSLQSCTAGQSCRQAAPTRLKLTTHAQHP